MASNFPELLRDFDLSGGIIDDVGIFTAKCLLVPYGWLNLIWLKNLLKVFSRENIK